VRTKIEKNITHPVNFTEQLLNWSAKHRECVFLDSNVTQNHASTYSQYDVLVAIDAFTAIVTDYENAWENLHQYQSQTRDWLFGYLSYDLKNNTEKLTSNNEDNLDFPDLYFFQPKKVIYIKNNQLVFDYLMLCEDEIETDYEEILNVLPNHKENKAQNIVIHAKISKEKYIHKIQQALHHISLGNIYEVNICMEFYAKKTKINPLQVFKKLNHISAAPFTTFLKTNNQYLLSASPERYLQRIENTVISQPIKGTAKRGKTTEEDAFIKDQLANNPKEKSENIMIVDLVRNDLSHTATKGSVKVFELCKAHSFKQVHQLISTITSNINNNTSNTEILQTTFPMGSMTGAPKIAAMQIIEDLEETKRGLFSGAVGYFSPNGNFDFNVVIRSILYNQQNQYVSFSVGSAITSQAIAEQEYEECMLKANAMFEVLSAKKM
jgi:para-aminobenzoate synthetase component I